jgi:amino acid adenylation domain-containing protein
MTKLLADILGQAARCYGSRPAVAEPGQSISYTDLDLRSDEIANAIQRAGIRPGARIGIFRRKSIETVAIIYGILKAGGAYVPIELKAGADRLDAILRDAEARLVFTEPVLLPKLEPCIQAGLIDWIASAGPDDDPLKFCYCANDSKSQYEILTPPSDPTAAYILYTSGSTGVPKGVVHTHASALAFASWAADRFALSSSDRLSCHASLNFDLTTFDLFAALLRGACVVLIPDALTIFPQRVASLIKDERLTVWYSVPFALMQLVSHGTLDSRHHSTLREIVFAGERYPPSSLRRLAGLFPRARLTNLFGPTETNVCTYHHVTPDDLTNNDFCPIGQACQYASLLIVDRMGNEVLAGEPGELLVGGPSVMKGYLNRSDLNAKVFVESPNGVRYFRTGDMVSIQADGLLRFHGRLDRQVKVRGFRIELDEIETILLGCHGITAAAVWVESGESEFHKIMAAVETETTFPISENLLIQQLSRSLSLAAVPRRIFILERLPRTINDKVDYDALAALG